jgi:hypothetical protein
MFFSLIFYSLLEIIGSDILMKRLICPPTSYRFSNLLAYVLGFSLYSITIINIGPLSSPLSYRGPPSYEVIGFTILFLLYFGRIVSIKKGSFYGKVHYSALFATSSISGLIGFAAAVSSPEVYTSYIDQYVNFISNTWGIAILGCYLLATIGEMMLNLAKSDSKSLIGISENFPNMVKIISDRNIKFDPKTALLDNDQNIKQLVEQLLANDLIDLKVASKNLFVAERIFDILLSDTYGVQAKDYRIRNITIKILSSNIDKIMKDYNELLDSRNFIDFLFLNSSKKESAANYLEIYRKRYKSIVELKNPKFQMREYNLIKYDYIITKYKDESSEPRKLLISFIDKLSSKRIWVLIEDPLIIDIFENTFDNAWNVASPWTAPLIMDK